MKRVAIAALLLLVPVIIVAVLLLLKPAVLVMPVANYYLASAEARLLDTTALQIGPRQTSAAAATLQVGNLTLQFSNLVVDYQAGGLLGGRLQTLQADRLLVDHNPRPEVSPGDESLTPAALLRLVRELPVQQIQLAEIAYHGDPVINASLSLNTAPLRISGELSSPDWAAWQLQWSLAEADSETVGGVARLFQEQQELFNAQLRLTAGTEVLDVTADSRVHLASLSAALLSSPAALELSTETLLVRGQARLRDLFGQPAVTDVSLSIDSPDSRLAGRLSYGAMTHSVQMHLPVQLTGNAAMQGPALSLAVDQLQANINSSSGDLTLAGMLELSALRVGCEQLPDCELGAAMILADGHWQTPVVEGGAARLAGRTEGTLSSRGVQLRAPELKLSLPEIRHAAGLAGADLTLDGLEIAWLDGLQVEMPVQSTGLRPGLDDLSLANPVLLGELALHEGKLTGALTLTVGQRLDATVTLDHDPDAEQGQALFSLPAVEFDKDQPLSALFSHAGLPVDLVGGSLSASAEIRWRKQGSEWLRGGPVELTMTGLSGVIAETVFVGLNSELRARVDNNTVSTPELLHASLETVDIGLPLERIDWRYGFDSEARSITVSALSTQVFDGTVEVPHFVYVANRDRNVLEVVFSNLDLRQIVALADYPQLQVSGEISGYIPLAIENGQLTIGEGLVSALNPGGSIRYTPTQDAGANAGMQFVNDALSNYLFETLNAELEYDQSGDLHMAVEMQGRNPDFNEGRPVHLNVNITDNIPSLLRSLQAGREISDRLERALNNR